MYKFIMLCILFLLIGILIIINQKLDVILNIMELVFK